MLRCYFIIIKANYQYLPCVRLNLYFTSRIFMTATTSTENRRVATGAMHLGNYHGALKNWLTMQHEYECFFFVADWHALTTGYENTKDIENNTWGLVIDWLAAGLNPKLCNIFIQSAVPEHAELHLLLSMITPLSWLERVPTYKDQQEKLKEKDLSTYGFLGYPTLQAADVLIYKAGFVPVGEDQVAHIELAREIARRFNHLYGKEVDFVERAELVIKRMSKKDAKLLRQLMKQYQEQGDLESLKQGHALLNTQVNLSMGERERLYGFLEGSGKIILPEPEPMLTKTTKFPGLDGRKMSKSYHNTIALTEDAHSVETKIKTMPTDPARVRRTDPGEPFKCPVWHLHEIYSTDEVKEWVLQGCRSAGIGCLDCKGQLLEAMYKEQQPIRERAIEYKKNLSAVHNIVQEGIENARDVAKTTLQEVRTAMGISYR